MSRTRNSAWNMAGGLLFTAVSVVCALAATPWLLRWLGAERFGAFKVLTDWLGYLVLLDLGLGGALLAALATRVAIGDDDGVRTTLAGGIRAYLGVVIVNLVFGLLLVAFIPAVVPAHRIPVDELRIAVAIGMAPALLAPLLVYRALAEARQRTYLMSLLLTVQSVLGTVLCLWAAYSHLGLAGQALGAAAAQLPVFLILAWDGSHAYGRPRLVPTDSDSPGLGALRWPSWIHGLADRVGLVSDSVVIAWLLGPAAVTPFVLTQQLALLAQFQLRGVGNATWAGLVQLFVQGNEELFRARLTELTRLVSGLGVATLGVIAAYNGHFVHLWVGAVGDAGVPVTVLACVNAWLWSIFSLWSWPILGAGFIGRWAPYSLGFIVINLTVSIWATRWIGSVGPLVGSCAAFLLVDTWAMPRVMRDSFRTDPTQIWLAALAPLRWGLPYAALLWWIAHAHAPAGWFGMAAEMLTAVALGLALCWRLEVPYEFRTRLRTRIERR